MLKFCHGGSGRRRDCLVSMQQFVVASSKGARSLVLKLRPAGYSNGTEILPLLPLFPLKEISRLSGKKVAGTCHGPHFENQVLLFRARERVKM